MAGSRKLILNVFFQRFGHHPEAWRHQANSGATGRPDLALWIRLAQLAEHAKFDSFFLADFIGRSADDLPSLAKRGASYQFEPMTLLSAIAASTQRIGLIATLNTNFSHPYHVARQFSSLDHISGGRAGWNIVSSLGEAPSANFGVEPLTHEQRYQRASEFVDLARSYWDSWEDDAFHHPDQASGKFFNVRDAHPVEHRGEHFASRGVLDMARPIQGHPVFVQAGNSETGREFAARIAEMTYCSAQTLPDAQAYYADVKGRMAKYGREQD